METQTNILTGADVIYSYTRSQAIEDGVLVDVSLMAKDAGIKFPVALTAALWAEYIRPSDDDAICCQSIEGRLWDTLMVFRSAARVCSDAVLLFYVSFVMKGRKMATPLLKAHICPGDNGEPVITIMLKDED